MFPSSSLLLLLCFTLVGLAMVSADGNDAKHDALSKMEIRKVHHLNHHYHHSKHHSKPQQDIDTTISATSPLIVMIPETTAGPYPEDISDYMYTSNLLTAARAGASVNLTRDRLTVLDAIPLALTLNVYSINNSTNQATPLNGVDVFIWHCDAIGVYSSVDLSTAPSNGEDTQGQYWLRGYQTTNTNGTVLFNTIVPGWYTGRALHFHVRVRLAGAANDTWAVTTQLFPSDALLSTITNISPYSTDQAQQTPVADDSVYSSIDPTIAQELILDITGSTTKGYASTFSMGLVLENETLQKLGL